MSLLEVRDVSKRFGGLQALDSVDLHVDAGRITSLIGPNGAGKTTLFNCITGALRADGGSVTLAGQALDGMEPHDRAAAGLGRTFQRLEVFTNMTVFENLQVAAEARHPAGVWRGLFKWSDQPDPRVLEAVEGVIERVGLADVRDEPAGDLSTGRLRMMELGRALCTEPKVLLLDEPASGLDADETVVFDQLLRALAGDGLGILLVEHDVDLVLDISDHLFCLDFGEMIADGTPEEIAANPAVRAAYLGVDDDPDDGGPDATAA